MDRADSHQVRTGTLPVSMRVGLAAARLGAGDERARGELERLTGTGAAGPVDWQETWLTARHHRIFTLALEGMERAGAAVLGQVPEPVLAAMRQMRRDNALHAIRLSLEAQRLILALRQVGVEASLLKGTALSMMLYGDPSLRHAGDLDLLAQGAPLAVQIERMTELGFKVTTPACRLTPRRLASFQHFWKDVTLEGTANGLVIELHWRLFNNRRHGANRLTAAGVEPVTVYGSTLPAMPRVEQFLYAAAHGASDEWVYMKGLVDIATFLRVLPAEEIDHAFTLAAELGLLEQVSSAVHLAEAWLDTAVSHPKLLPASDPFHRVMYERVLARLRETAFRPARRQLGPRDATALELRLVPGWRTLVELWERFLWRPRIWGAYDLPDELFWLYPLLGCLTLPRPAPAE